MTHDLHREWRSSRRQPDQYVPYIEWLEREVLTARGGVQRIKDAAFEVVDLYVNRDTCGMVTTALEEAFDAQQASCREE